ASEESLEYWAGRLKDLGVERGGIETVDGRAQLRFEDPEGQRLAFVVEDAQGPESTPWDDSPVPAEHQLRGLGPVIMTVRALPPTDALLRDVTNMRAVRSYEDPEGAGGEVHVDDMGEGGPHAELHVAVQPRLEPARPGAGGVHHVAFRAPDDETHRAWLDRLTDMRVQNSGWVDRFWFHSIYFREPGGVLFEIATDGPGFGVDEEMDALGETVVLPPFLEAHRQRIVSNLKPID